MTKVSVSTDRSVSLHVAGATESWWGVQSPRSAAQQARHRLLHLPDPGDCDGLPERVLRSPQAGGQSSLWTVNNTIVVCFALLCLFGFFFRFNLVLLVRDSRFKIPVLSHQRS